MLFYFTILVFLTLILRPNCVPFKKFFRSDDYFVRGQSSNGTWNVRFPFLNSTHIALEVVSEKMNITIKIESIIGIYKLGFGVQQYFSK